MRDPRGLICPRCDSPDVWRWHREAGVMKFMAFALGLMMMTCRACGHRFYVKSNLPPVRSDEGLFDEPLPEPEKPIIEAVALQQAETTPVEVPAPVPAEPSIVAEAKPPRKRGIKVRIKIRTNLKAFRAASS